MQHILNCTGGTIGEIRVFPEMEIPGTPARPASSGWRCCQSTIISSVFTGCAS